MELVEKQIRLTWRKKFFKCNSFPLLFSQNREKNYFREGMDKNGSEMGFTFSPEQCMKSVER